MANGEFIAHVLDICNAQESELPNPHEYLTYLLSLEPTFSSEKNDSDLPLSNFLLEILFEFEVASVANRVGDAYLFYKFFANMLFKAISIHARLKGNESWQNPSYYLNQLDNEIEQNYLGSLFPGIDLENGNTKKERFIDWFEDIVDQLADSDLPLELSFSLNQIPHFLRCIYRRDYLINFRPVQYLQNVFRSPNPARFSSESDLLERFFIKHNITQVIDLRGEQEAKNSPYIEKLLARNHIKSMVVDFNEPKSSEISGSSYKKMTYFLKGVVKEVFSAILGRPGATLFHCASGKDRTGVIAALLQELAGVPEEEILKEYKRSGLDTRTDKFLDLLSFIQEQGGIEQYLDTCGISRADQEALREKITSEPMPAGADT